MAVPIARSIHAATIMLRQDTGGGEGVGSSSDAGVAGSNDAAVVCSNDAPAGSNTGGDPSGSSDPSNSGSIDNTAGTANSANQGSADTAQSAGPQDSTPLDAAFSSTTGPNNFGNGSGSGSGSSGGTAGTADTTNQGAASNAGSAALGIAFESGGQLETPSNPNNLQPGCQSLLPLLSALFQSLKKIKTLTEDRNLSKQDVA